MGGDAEPRSVDGPDRGRPGLWITRTIMLSGPSSSMRPPCAGVRMRHSARRPGAGAPGSTRSGSASGSDEFGGLGDDVHQGAVAHHGDRKRPADRVGEHQPLQRLRPAHGLTSSGEDQIPAP